MFNLEIPNDFGYPQVKKHSHMHSSCLDHSAGMFMHLEMMIYPSYPAFGGEIHVRVCACGAKSFEFVQK